MERIDTQTAHGQLVDGAEAGEFQAVRIDLDGWFEQRIPSLSSRAPYRAAVWVSPELRRPIRFEASSRSQGNASIAAFIIDETAELTGVFRN